MLKFVAKSYPPPQACRLTRHTGFWRNFKGAFTLAEVLITLGIIGVVAALTMPSLIQNYQNQVVVNKLKKSYSMWSQAFQKMMADEGVERLSDTEMFKNIDNNIEQECGFEGASQRPCCDVVFNKMTQYVKMDKITPVPVKLVNGAERNWHKSNVADGTRLLGLLFYGYYPYNENTGTNLHRMVGEITIDVNVSKDIGQSLSKNQAFRFVISDDGKLYPYGGKDFAIYYAGSTENEYYWKNASSSGYYSCPSHKNKPLSGCAARIMENGWKIDY